MISILDLGLCDYGTALRLQERLVELRKADRIGDVLLLVEHTPVITLGRNAKEANIVAPAQVLASRGVETFEINRGGDVTFHGPGQLVAYPIFNLLQFTPKLGVVEFVRRLEEVLIHVCGQYRLETQRIKGLTGVWTLATPPARLEQRTIGRDYEPMQDEAVDSRTPQPGHDSMQAKEASMGDQKWSERKIAAIGVHVSRGVTSHGFALNVTTDLDFFKLIVPCGLTKPVTSIEFESAERPAMDEVKHVAVRAFSQVFREQVLWLESLDDLLATVEDRAQGPANREQESHTPQDTPARAPENLRRIRGEDTHLV